ncbi:MAG: ABC transporter permease, partial [Coprobacillus sp.]
MNNLKSKITSLFKKEGSKSLVSSLVAIGMGLLFGLIIIIIANPSDALSGFKILLTGGFYRGAKSIGQVFYLAVPIMMTGLSVAFAFKCGEFNIGTPGQFLVGSFTAVFVALKCTFIPDSVLWIVCILAAGLAGAIWAIIPGILKAFKNVNVVISCIMCNYIAMLLVIEGIKAFIYNPTGAESYAVPVSKAIPA